MFRDTEVSSSYQSFSTVTKITLKYGILQNIVANINKIQGNYKLSNLKHLSVASIKTINAKLPMKCAIYPKIFFGLNARLPLDILIKFFDEHYPGKWTGYDSPVPWLAGSPN